MSRTACIEYLESLRKINKDLKIGDVKILYDREDAQEHAEKVLSSSIKYIKNDLEAARKEEARKLQKDFPEMNLSWCIEKAEEMIL